MSGILLKLLNMSISAGWLILAVILLRFALKKAPRCISCALWAATAIRLVLPFSFESIFSLVPSAETVPMNIEYAAAPAINTGIPPINDIVNPVISHSLAPDPASSANPMQVIVAVAAAVWAAGVIIMLLCALVSALRIKRRIRESVNTANNVYICDNISSPFIFGLFRPKIYMPSGIDGAATEYIAAHEATHIRRCDHIWKPAGYILLAAHWFNPLVWLAYILLCRDIELACDEKVIRDMDPDGRAAYSEALLSCSTGHRLVAACPLAFGEVGVKERVRSVLNYKKPAFWIIIAAVAACAVIAVCFLTNPHESEPLPPENTPEAASRVVDIVDRTKTEGIDVEKWDALFWQDSENYYLYPTNKKNYVYVLLDDGSHMSVSDALTQEIISVSDLDKYGIEYYYMPIRYLTIRQGDTEIIPRFEFAWSTSDGIAADGSTQAEYLRQDQDRVPALNMNQPMTLNLAEGVRITGGIALYDMRGNYITTINGMPYTSITAIDENMLSKIANATDDDEVYAVFTAYKKFDYAGNNREHEEGEAQYCMIKLKRNP